MAAEEETKDETGAGRGKDAENQLERIPYPKSVAFIVSNEFCERFSFYGMRTVLSIYMVDKLLFSESTATIIFHAFVMMVYFFPVLGAILADSFLGKFRTIFYVSMVYAAGNVVLALASTPPLNLPMAEISMVGLALIAVGTGGIKPCVAAFGGDQFVLPQQRDQLEKFFSWFYFSINAGSLLSIGLTPLLKQEVQCFGDETCFPLAFAVPGVLMILSVVIFAAGKRLYIIKPAEGNVIVDVARCMGRAVSNKFKSKGPKKDHWLDYAVDDFGPKLVQDIKAVLKVLVIYLPLPIFWALYDQQGSGWTFMARRMDGDLGFYNIPAEQIQIVNPILILIFIPLFAYVFYPLLGKCRLLRTPLQRLAAGMVLCVVSFVISGLFCIMIEDRLPVLPSEGNAQVRLYNGLGCDLRLTGDLFGKTPVKLASLGNFTKIGVEMSGNTSRYDYQVESSCGGTSSGTFELKNGEASAYYFGEIGKLPTFMEDDVAKSETSRPKIRLLINHNGKTAPFTVKFVERGENMMELQSDDTKIHEVGPAEYDVRFDLFSTKVKLKAGGVYTIVAYAITKDKFIVNVVEVTEANSVSSLYLLPQYVVMTMAEVMFSVTGLEFAYSQAPTSMKSVLQACWLLTTAFGNLVIIVIESIGHFEQHSKMFFLYSGILLVDFVAFTLIATRYVYVKQAEEEDAAKIKDADGKSKGGIDNAAFKKNDE